MSTIGRDPSVTVEKGHAAGEAPSEFAINTPTGEQDAGADAFDAVAASGMSARRSFSRASTFSRSDGRRTNETARRSMPLSQAKSIHG